jgi:hypothetical protein
MIPGKDTLIGSHYAATAQQGAHGLRALIAVAVSVVHQDLHLSHHLASTSMVVGIACPGLPAPNNDAAALCRDSTAQDC